MPRPHLPALSPRCQAARDLALELMARHGLVDWEFRFNRAKRRVGVCYFPQRGRPGRIELSIHFPDLNPDDEVRDTILHEIAHALVGPGHGHDAVWRAKCIEIGAKPRRCYDAAVVEMPTGRWHARCPSCNRDFHRHRRPRGLGNWFCLACGETAGKLRFRLSEAGRRT